MTDTQKKYEYSGKTKQCFGHTLHQIRALVAITSMGVSAGDIGGWIEAEKNLSQNGNAWVSGDARVSGSAEVLWLSPVGSENSALTLFRTKEGALINRGCFTGSLDEFAKAVEACHGDSQIGEEYKAITTLLRLRIASWPDRAALEQGETK